jgi:hypothetical protein
MATYQDGSFPSGAPILVTGANNYVCNSFSVDKAAETVQILDQNGAPSGALQFEGFRTGTAELQFAGATTVEPTTAAANSTRGVFINVNIDGANVNCFITSVGVQKPQRGPWLATCAWQARVNA